MRKESIQVHFVFPVLSLQGEGSRLLSEVWFFKKWGPLII